MEKTGGGRPCYEMTRIGLVFRNLRHFRPTNLAVAGGMAVATAVLAGAARRRQRAREPAGAGRAQDGAGGSCALATRFFEASWPGGSRRAPEFAKHFEACAAGVTVRGGAAREDTVKSAAGVQIAALDRWLDVPPGSCVVNRELADELDIGRGPHSSSTSRLSRTCRAGRRSASRRADTTGASRRQAAQDVAPEQSMAALFNLAGGQRRRGMRG